MPIGYINYVNENHGLYLSLWCKAKVAMWVVRVIQWDISRISMLGECASTPQMKDSAENCEIIHFNRKLEHFLNGNSKGTGVQRDCMFFYINHKVKTQIQQSNIKKIASRPFTYEQWCLVQLHRPCYDCLEYYVHVSQTKEGPAAQDWFLEQQNCFMRRNQTTGMIVFTRIRPYLIEAFKNITGSIVKMRSWPFRAKMTLKFYTQKAVWPWG